MNEFTVEYVELPNGRIPAREFIDSLDDKAAARVDAFIERLRTFGNRMQGKRQTRFVRERARRSKRYRSTFQRTLHQIDLAVLVREMRESARLTQAELARRAGTTQSVIVRLENAEYSGHSLSMLERIASACGVSLKLRAERKPHFDRELALV